VVNLRGGRLFAPDLAWLGQAMPALPRAFKAARKKKI
jgi:hypothetical protein